MAALAATCALPAALSLRASALRAGSAPRSLSLSSSSSPSLALRSDFTCAKLASAFASCEISGSALLPSSLAPGAARPQGRGALVVRAGGTSLGCTKRHASRKKRARVSGFRVRMSTKDGINVLKRRRARGRKELVPQTSSPSGKRA